MAEGGPLIHGWQPVKIAVCCQGYERVQRGKLCGINLPVRSVRRILALCPVCLWMGLPLQTPFSHFLFITLMHSLPGHIQTLSDSFTHTYTQISSLQSVSCCPNTSTVGARSLLPIWPTGLRERHLISPLPPDRRGLILFPGPESKTANTPVQPKSQGQETFEFSPPHASRSTWPPGSTKSRQYRPVCRAAGGRAAGAHLPRGHEPNDKQHFPRCWT